MLISGVPIKVIRGVERESSHMAVAIVNTAIATSKASPNRRVFLRLSVSGCWGDFVFNGYGIASQSRKWSRCRIAHSLSAAERFPGCHAPSPFPATLLLQMEIRQAVLKECLADSVGPFRSVLLAVLWESPAELAEQWLSELVKAQG